LLFICLICDLQSLGFASVIRQSLLAFPHFHVAAFRQEMLFFGNLWSLLLLYQTDLCLSIGMVQKRPCRLHKLPARLLAFRLNAVRSKNAAWHLGQAALCMIDDQAD